MDSFKEFPKWVTAHESHVVRHDTGSGAPVAVSVPAFPHHHVDRVTHQVTVLVHDEEEEKRASEPASVEHDV